MDDSRATDQMPQTIGRYQIQEGVGFGAMGAVYKAFDPLIKRTLAIKTIRLDIPRQSPQYKSFIERFYHEARISGTLSHPNIVTLFDIGEEGGLPYLAMEFVEGETIASILDRGMKFKPENVIALVSQIASAVDYAHAKGVIHRDIKPSNLILFDGDKVKVTDFGIAKLADAEMTQSGTLLGTPSYMSPEQAMGEKLDGRSDIFSLGVCAFEMLSGEQPFPGSNVTAILYKLVHVDPIEPANLEMNGLVPQRWHEVFNRVLAKKPDDRYQSASEFVQDLEYCLGAWFGAVGEETISENAGAVKAGIADVPSVPRSKQAAAKTLPPAPLSDGDAATVHLKAVPRPLPVPAPKPAPARAAAPAAAGPATGTEKTVMLDAAQDTSTVVLKAADVARAGASAVPAAPRGPAQDVTLKAPPQGVTMKVPAPDVTVKAPAQDVTMKASAAAAAPTVRATAPTFPAAPAPVKAAAPAPAPIRTHPPSARPAMPTVTTGRHASAPSHRPAPPPPPAKKGAPTGLILGGAGLVLLGGLIAAGVIAYRKFGGAGTETVEVRPSAPPTPARRSPPRTAALAMGSLRIESQPPGATVTVDGADHGVTPADLTGVPFGPHAVKVELKGFAPSTQTVLLSAAAPQSELKLTLSRTPPPTGQAEIASDPPGATVRVDGTPVGQTPFADPKMKTGSHRVEIAKEGFEPWSGTIAVQAGKKARVDARLRAIQVAAPTPPPEDVVDRDRIYVNVPPEVDTPARKSSGTSASYPTDRAPRLRSGDSVSVRINFVVTETGEVTDVRVVESGGRVVDDAVQSAVKRWRYSPAIKKGTPVKVRVEFKQTFRAG